jgi:tetratricopeptide (TPR) repeat protein
MKVVTSVSFALVLILASPGGAKDTIDVSAANTFVAPATRPDRAHLKRGDSGGEVRILQKALNKHGEHLMVDGIFRRQTEKAVKDFQARSDLETTGEVDSGTWSALAAKSAPVSNPARELVIAKQAAEEAKAQVMELATQVASLNSELGTANAQHTELQIKLDLATSVAESAQSQLKEKQSYLEKMQSELETARQDAQQAKAKATEFASSLANLNSELDKANTQRNELQTKLDQSGWEAVERFELMIKEIQSELEIARQDAEQAKAKATEFASLLARLNASGDLQTSDSPQQSAKAFRPNEQPTTIYIDTPALATAYIKVGNVLMAQGDLTEALNSYRDGLAVAVRASKTEPEDPAWQHKITLIFIKVGDVLMAQGNFAAALKSYREALAVADRFATSDSEDAGWQRNLSLAYNKIGDALAAAGNLTEALKISQDSLAIRERLAEADSSDTDAQRDLAISQSRVAAILAEQGDAARALDLLQQARVIIARLVEQSPDNDQLSKDLAVFNANIAKLEQASTPDSEAVQPEQAVR